jgi:hypothetical protein
VRSTSSSSSSISSNSSSSSSSSTSSRTAVIIIIIIVLLNFRRNDVHQILIANSEAVRLRLFGSNDIKVGI